MTELRTLIIPCHYDASFENNFLRDRFLAGVRSKKVGKRLFIEQNYVNLTRCVELEPNVERNTSEASKVKEVKPAAKKHEIIGAVRTSKSYHNDDKHRLRSK